MSSGFLEGTSYTMMISIYSIKKKTYVGTQMSKNTNISWIGEDVADQDIVQKVGYVLNWVSVWVI